MSLAILGLLEGHSQHSHFDPRILVIQRAMMLFVTRLVLCSIGAEGSMDFWLTRANDCQM
jgi:hypothetical protein